MSVKTSVFSQLLQQCGDLVDNKALTLADIDLAVIATKSGDIKRISKLVPMNDLIRHNFIEVFIRLSEHRFIKSG
jgi:hypothetical protein